MALLTDVRVIGAGLLLGNIGVLLGIAGSWGCWSWMTLFTDIRVVCARLSCRNILRVLGR